MSAEKTGWATQRKRASGKVVLPIFRFLLFSVVIFLIHDQHRNLPRFGHADDGKVLEISSQFFPNAIELTSDEPSQPIRYLLDESGKELGSVLRTSPQSDFIVGYSGPSDLLMMFDENGRVIGFEILGSGDTPEHVKLVESDKAFMRSFNGMSWDELRDTTDVDGVSGATLTSLAMTESLLHRIRGPGPSLRFPASLTLDELRSTFPQAKSIAPFPSRPNLLQVLDTNGTRIGAAARTSPYGDNLPGYQGPTELLLALEPDGDTIRRMQIRGSYETPEYLEYVREDEMFLADFHGRSISYLAGPEFNPDEVEGVSGATMTSQAIALALKRAATPWLQKVEDRAELIATFRLRDLGTITMLILGMCLAFSRLRGDRRIRIAFQCLLIVYLGFINGDLLSQALWVGWAQHGVPWRTAPGLALLTLAALLLPLSTHRQVYCHQLCPHGAAQQLTRTLLPTRLHLSQRRLRLLRPLPFLLLGFILVVAMKPLAVNLAALEAFDAYLIRAAGWATILIAVAGLIASLFIPMAYCRYGCPTGAALNFLWAGGKPGSFTRRDGAAVVLVLLAVGLRIIA